MIRGAMALAVMLAAGPVVAQTPDCTNPMTQIEMTYCAEQDWMTADKDLNAAYREARDAMRELDAAVPGERGAEGHLLEAQRAWITLRDAHCAAEGWKMHGGSAEPMLIYGCRARMTRARTVELRDLAVGY